MKGTIQISTVLAAAVLLAACAKKEEVVVPEPAASAPVEMAAPAETVPMDAAPTEMVPMDQGAMTDPMTAPDAAATGEVEDPDRAGGDRVAP